MRHFAYDFWVPRYKWQLVAWYKQIKPTWQVARWSKKKLYAVMFKIMDNKEYYLNKV